jgi:N-acetylated-alpha-linked acidic dipeptidase
MSLALRSPVAFALALILLPAPAQRPDEAWDARFRALPSTDSLRSYMRHLSARPHHLGSPYGLANARWMRDRFAAWGWDARIDTFDVLFPTPRERVVELVAPRRSERGWRSRPSPEIPPPRSEPSSSPATTRTPPTATSPRPSCT